MEYNLQGIEFIDNEDGFQAISRAFPESKSDGVARALAMIEHQRQEYEA